MGIQLNHAPVVSAANPPTFTNVSGQAGLTYRGSTWGWAWGDYDDDGYLDLFLANHPDLSDPDGSVDSDLFHNNRNGTFANVMAGSGILLQEDRHDMIWVDYDNDRDLDLYVSIGGRSGSGIPGPSQLYRNDGNGVFVDVAVEAGMDYPLGRGRGVAWLDYDNDGDLDMIYTGAQSDIAPNAFFENNGDGTFTDVTALVGIAPFVGAQSNVAVADYDGDGDQDIFVTGLNSDLYRNDDGVFTLVEDVGLRATSAQSADWGDYDNDGHPDLYVARGAHDGGLDYWQKTGNVIRFLAMASAGDEDGLDFSVPAGSSLTFELREQAGGLFPNPLTRTFIGAGRLAPASHPFTLTEAEASGAPVYTPGVDDGFFIWSTGSGQWHIRWTGVGGLLNRFSGIITASAAVGTVNEVVWEPMTDSDIPNQLFHNKGDGTFEEVGAAAGVAEGGDCRGADWGDYDNDGDLDLFVHTVGNIDGRSAHRLYRNNGNGTFTDVAQDTGLTGTDLAQGWGAVWADYNNDGYLDLLTNHVGWSWPFEDGFYDLFRNDGSGNHWLKIDLRGVETNSRGYGAKVWVSAGGKEIYREVADGSHYFIHYSGPLHVGLGSATRADIRIEWPTGEVQEFNDVPVDRRIRIREGDTELPTNHSCFLPFILR